MDQQNIRKSMNQNKTIATVIMVIVIMEIINKTIGRTNQKITKILTKLYLMIMISPQSVDL
jgi:hypothetical protein